MPASPRPIAERGLPKSDERQEGTAPVDDNGCLHGARRVRIRRLFRHAAALAEFAIGNRERAIQLLDDFLTKGSPYDGDRNRGFAASEKVSKAAQLCGNVQDKSKKKSCEVHSEQLSRARHLIVRARLETLEDNASPNRPRTDRDPHLAPQSRPSDRLNRNVRCRNRL